MIIRSRQRLPILASDREQVYPVLPLRTGVLFPSMTLTLQVGRKENLQLIEDCRKGKKQFVASYQSSDSHDSTEPSIHEVSVFATVVDCKKGPGESLIVTLEGRRRTAITRIHRIEPYTVAAAAELQESKVVAASIRTRIEEVVSIVREITQLDPTYSTELLYVLEMNVEHPGILADKAAFTFHFPLSAKQELLEAVKLEARFNLLLKYLNRELSRVATIHNINENVRKNLEQEQQRVFLRQQLNEIRKQLGEDFSEEKEATRIKGEIRNNPLLPPEVIARATIEADRLGQLSTASAEYGVTRSYLDWVLDLPWGKCTPENYDLADAKKTLSTDYFGPESVKEQILQRLSVRKLLGGVNEGPTLCLVGAPGTGKASLAKAIARAMGKELVRISMGGIQEVSEIKGMSRTFLGAMPGKILRTLKDAGSCDPVILVEDIDYFNMDNDSSVNMALLEVTDTRKNSRFLDNYLGIPFDLSKIFFICSVRSFEEIPEQFLPRFEIIELPGYIEREKVAIAKRYIVPTLLKKHGLLKSDMRLADKVLARVISNYTMEAGLLGFSQQIEKICRRIALEKVEGKKNKWTVNNKFIETILGPPIYLPEKAESQPEIGTATGLAWTGAGGELMFIEGLKMRGEGQIITTGSLGDVMRESILAAHSYVKSKADMLAIDYNDFREFDIHIHLPSGAIPKDGPSAGVTVSLVIASVLAERPIRNDIAMTGEVTLRGRVLAVGGVKEKISAAYRTGIMKVALPSENRKDLKDLPKEIIRKVKFFYIDRVDELFELCLLDFTPSSFTLEKLFAEEIEKARKKKRPSPSVRRRTVKRRPTTKK